MNTTSSNLTLQEFFSTHYVRKRLRPQTAKFHEAQLYNFTRYFEHWLTETDEPLREPCLSDLTKSHVEGAMAFRVKERSRNAADKLRQAMVSLWNYAAEQGFTEWPPKIEPWRVRVKEVSPRVIKGMTAATFALATGSTLDEAATIAGVSRAAMRDWKRSHPERWQALYASAMKQVVENVREAAGTDAVLDDPDRFMKQALACEKWTERRGETLFPTRDDRPTVRSFFDDYFKPICLVDDKSATVDSYEQVVRQWVRLTGDPPLEEITVPVLAKFRECQSRMRGRQPGSKKSPNSVRSVLRHLQTILDKAGEPHRRNRDAAGILDKVPYVKPPREIVRNPRAATIEQIDAVYAAAVAAEIPRIEGFKPPAWWRALLVVTLNTAFRRRTLFELRMADIGWRDRSIRVDPSQIKNSVGCIVPLNDTTLEHLKAIRTNRELVFPWAHSLTHFHDTFHKLQDAAGIPRAEHFGLHAIRKLAATLLWEHSPAIAQLTLGHSSLQTTRKHYIAGGDMLRNAIDQLPQPASFTKHESQDDSNEIRVA